MFLCQPRHRKPLPDHPGYILVAARLPEDLDTLWTFAQATHKPHMGPAFPPRKEWQAKLEQRWQTEPDGLWLLRDPTDKPIGCLHTSTTAYTKKNGEPAGHIHEVHVAPKNRSQGLGTAMLTQAQQHLANRGFDAAQLHVFATNTAAIGLYQHLDWRIASTHQLAKTGLQQHTMTKAIR